MSINRIKSYDEFSINENVESKVKKGDRVELIEMVDDPNPIEKGERGTVHGVDDMGHILVEWDNGRTLSLVPGVDIFNHFYLTK